MGVGVFGMSGSEERRAKRELGVWTWGPRLGMRAGRITEGGPGKAKGSMYTLEASRKGAQLWVIGCVLFCFFSFSTHFPFVLSRSRLQSFLWEQRKGKIIMLVDICRRIRGACLKKV